MDTPQFHVDMGGEGSPVLVATGDIDLANVEAFAAALAEATEAGADRMVTVDLSAVTYCDSAAVRALFAAAADAKLTLVVSATGAVKTVLGISGLDRVTTVRYAD
jgi:anti-sigma B factor antagonist